jgi:hypothetical protein
MKALLLFLYQNGKWNAICQIGKTTAILLPSLGETSSASELLRLTLGKNWIFVLVLFPTSYPTKAKPFPLHCDARKPRKKWSFVYKSCYLRCKGKNTCDLDLPVFSSEEEVQNWQSVVPGKLFFSAIEELLRRLVIGERTNHTSSVVAPTGS